MFAAKGVLGLSSKAGMFKRPPQSPVVLMADDGNLMSNSERTVRSQPKRTPVRFARASVPSIGFTRRHSRPWRCPLTTQSEHVRCEALRLLVRKPASGAGGFGGEGDRRKRPGTNHLPTQSIFHRMTNPSATRDSAARLLLAGRGRGSQVGFQLKRTFDCALLTSRLVRQTMWPRASIVGTQLALGGTARKSRQILKTEGE